MQSSSNKNNSDPFTSNTNSNNNNVEETEAKCAVALQQAMRKGQFTAYYTHLYKLPLAHNNNNNNNSSSQSLPHNEAIVTTGDFSFLPFPEYCGLGTVDKVLYKHHLNFDMVFEKEELKNE